MGQTRGVLVYNLLAKGTIDYYIKRVLHGKSKVSSTVLGDTLPTMAEIREMLRDDEL